MIFDQQIIQGDRPENKQCIIYFSCDPQYWAEYGLLAGKNVSPKQLLFLFVRPLARWATDVQQPARPCRIHPRHDVHHIQVGPCLSCAFAGGLLRARHPDGGGAHRRGGATMVALLNGLLPRVYPHAHTFK